VHFYVADRTFFFYGFQTASPRVSSHNRGTPWFRRSLLKVRSFYLYPEDSKASSSPPVVDEHLIAAYKCPLKILPFLRLILGKDVPPGVFFFWGGFFFPPLAFKIHASPILPFHSFPCPTCSPLGQPSGNELYPVNDGRVFAPLSLPTVRFLLELLVTTVRKTCP